MYAIHEASLQSHELYCDDPNRLLLWLDRYQLQLKLNYLLQLLSCQPNIFQYTLILRHSIIPRRERVDFFSRTTPFLHRTILHCSFVVFIPEEENPSRTSIIVFRNFRNAIKVQSSPKTCFPTLSISDFYSLAVYLNEKLSYTTPILPFLDDVSAWGYWKVSREAKERVGRVKIRKEGNFIFETFSFIVNAHDELVIPRRRKKLCPSFSIETPASEI